MDRPSSFRSLSVFSAPKLGKPLLVLLPSQMRGCVQGCLQRLKRAKSERPVGRLSSHPGSQQLRNEASEEYEHGLQRLIPTPRAPASGPEGFLGLATPTKTSFHHLPAPSNQVFFGGLLGPNRFQLVTCWRCWFGIVGFSHPTTMVSGSAWFLATSSSVVSTSASRTAMTLASTVFFGRKRHVESRRR